MGNENLNKDKLIAYWIDGADDDFETMIAMYNSKNLVGHYLYVI